MAARRGLKREAARCGLYEEMVSSQRINAAPPHRIGPTAWLPIVVIAFVALGFSSACSLPNPNWATSIDLEVVLAPVPDSWKDLRSFGHRLVLPSGDATTTVAGLASGAGERSVIVRIEKRTNLPILDYPVLAGRNDLLKPAGAIYPLSLDDRGRLLMSYRDGFLAELLFPVSRAGDLLEAINAERMSDEIWNRSRGDPWAVERDAILETLLYGTMRSDRIRRKQSFDLVLNVAPGSWFTGDPFLGPYNAEVAQPRIELEELPTGVHRFFRRHEGTVDRMDLYVTEDGWLAVTGLFVESGSW